MANSFLNALNKMTPAQRQGLIQGGLGILASPSYGNFGQQLGKGGLIGLQGYQEAQRIGILEAQQKAMDEYRKEQLLAASQKAQQEQADKEQARDIYDKWIAGGTQKAIPSNVPVAVSPAAPVAQTPASPSVPTLSGPKARRWATYPANREEAIAENESLYSDSPVQQAPGFTDEQVAQIREENLQAMMADYERSQDDYRKMQQAPVRSAPVSHIGAAKQALQQDGSIPLSDAERTARFGLEIAPYNKDMSAAAGRLATVQHGQQTAAFNERKHKEDSVANEAKHQLELDKFSASQVGLKDLPTGVYSRIADGKIVFYETQKTADGFKEVQLDSKTVYDRGIAEKVAAAARVSAKATIGKQSKYEERTEEANVEEATIIRKSGEAAFKNNRALDRFVGASDVATSGLLQPVYSLVQNFFATFGFNPDSLKSSDEMQSAISEILQNRMQEHGARGLTDADMKVLAKHLPTISTSRESRVNVANILKKQNDYDIRLYDEELKWQEENYPDVKVRVPSWLKSWRMDPKNSMPQGAIDAGITWKEWKELKPSEQEPFR